MNVRWGGGVLLGLSLVVGLLVWGPRNWDQIQLHQALLGSAPAAPLATQWAAAPNPQRAYGLGLLALQQMDEPAADRWLAQALVGDERYLELARQQRPTSTALAQTATEHYPANAVGWDWRGDVTLSTTPTLALTYYQHAAELRPLDNLIWEKVGGLAYQQNVLDLAQTAFQHACDLNPQRNGACLSAGRLAFAAQDWATCVAYFERGSYPENAADWAKLIYAAQQLGHATVAERYWQQAQQEYPADYAALLAELP